MTTWITIMIVLAGIVLKLLSSPPSALVAWVLSKFALHPKLNSNEVLIKFDGKSIEGEEKNKFIDHFNEAVFLERNHIFPGDEKKYLHPETGQIPFIIHDKSRKKELNFFVYCEAEKIFVVKQKKNKVASYNLKSDNLHHFNVSNR